MSIDGSKESSKQEPSKMKENEESEVKGVSEMDHSVEDIMIEDILNYGCSYSPTPPDGLICRPAEHLKLCWQKLKGIQGKSGEDGNEELLSNAVEQFDERLYDFLELVNEVLTEHVNKEREYCDNAVFWHKTTFQEEQQLCAMWLEFDDIINKYGKLVEWDAKKGKFKDPMWDCAYQWMSRRDKFGGVAVAAKTTDWSERKIYGPLLTKPLFDACWMNYDYCGWWKCEECKVYNRVQIATDECYFCGCVNQWAHLNKCQYIRCNNRDNWTLNYANLDMYREDKKKKNNSV